MPLIQQKKSKDNNRLSSEYSILLVNTQQSINVFLQELSVTYQFNIDLVSDAKSAFQKLLQKTYSMLLIAPELDNLDGEQLTEIIQGSNDISELAIVFITGEKTAKHTVVQAYKNGAIDFISAPFDKEVIASKLMAIGKMQSKTTRSNDFKTSLQQSNMVLEEYAQSLTNSMVYAKGIQSGILQTPQELNKVFPESFVFFESKEALSGDFYWTSQSYNLSIVAVADCVGHGVSGALMSIIGSNFLNQIVDELQLLHPEEILQSLDQKITSTFDKNRKNRSPSCSEGMDIGLCAYDRRSKKLFYSGARRPLYLLRDKELITYKGDAHSIGDTTTKKKKFHCHEIQIQENDTIYLTTDGYVDQFGGNSNRKYLSKKLKDTLKEIQWLTIPEQEEFLRNDFQKWKGDSFQVDDVTVLGIRF